MYSLTPDRPDDLVERYARIEVTERLTSTKEVRPLEDAEIDRVVAEIAALKRGGGGGQPAVQLPRRPPRDAGSARHCAAPCPAYRSRCRARSPASSASTRAPRRRSSTPRCGRSSAATWSVPRARSPSRASTAPFLVMQSNGGCVPARARRGERPSAGAVRTGGRGDRAPWPRGAGTASTNVISLDMGGTSTDVCLVRDGVSPMATDAGGSRPRTPRARRRHPHDRGGRRQHRVGRQTGGCGSGRSPPARCRDPRAIGRGGDRPHPDRRPRGARHPRQRASSPAT